MNSRHIKMHLKCKSSKLKFFLCTSWRNQMKWDCIIHSCLTSVPEEDK